jgi:hypothetical protein
VPGDDLGLPLDVKAGGHSIGDELTRRNLILGRHAGETSNEVEWKAPKRAGHLASR